MKKSCIVAAVLLAAACSPQVYPLYLDVRQPSTSGIDLSGKEIAIVYMDGVNAVDSLFDRQAASSLARELEADYFGGSQAIGLYHIPSADTVSLDLMHTLVMDTGGDIVFVLSTSLGEPALEGNRAVPSAKTLDSAYVCPVNVPVQTKLRVYDAMGDDKVQNFSGKAVLRSVVYNSGTITDDGIRTLALKNLDGQAEEVGNRISSRFLSQWATDSFSFYYFDDTYSNLWMKGLEKAYQGKFAEAVDQWAILVQRLDGEKKACASYNIAMALYLMGDYGMSARWLEQAKKLENLSLAPGLEKRLSARLEKTQK